MMPMVSTCFDSLYVIPDLLFSVLTKVVVYAGIAILACELLPLMFEMVGWGVFSWVY